MGVSDSHIGYPEQLDVRQDAYSVCNLLETEQFDAG